MIQNAVNVPSVSYEEYVQMQPFITLGERLGSFLAQAIGEEGGVREIALRYTGRVANWQTQLLRNAVTMGVLNSMLAEEANLVNAEAIAGSRGVRVRESAKEKTTAGGGAGDVIEVTLRTGVGEHTVAGTVLHGRSPRILSVDGLDIEAPLAHDLIFLRNRDVPGVIGRIGTILGEHQINIANFSLGREEEPGPSGPSGDVEAVSVIQVDTPAPEKVLAELRKIPAITKARAIQLG